MHDITGRIAEEQSPQYPALTRAQYDQIIVAGDRFHGDGFTYISSAASLQHRNILMLQLLPKLGDVVGHPLCVLLCGQMVKRDLRMEALGQLADENQAVFHVADDLTERHQDTPGVWFGHGDGPHDCQV